MVILFDAGLVALETTCISPGKGIHHSSLRCHTLPSGENFSRQRPAPWFYDRFFSCQYSATFSFLPRGVTGNSGYHFEYNLHLIKILARTIRKSIYCIMERRCGQKCDGRKIVLNPRSSHLDPRSLHLDLQLSHLDPHLGTSILNSVWYACSGLPPFLA